MIWIIFDLVRAMPVETLKVTKDVQAVLEIVGQQLRRAREAHDESLEDVAAALKTTAARVRRAEAGRSSVALGMYAMLLRRYGRQHDLLALGAPQAPPTRARLAGKTPARTPAPDKGNGHGRAKR